MALHLKSSVLRLYIFFINLILGVHCLFFADLIAFWYFFTRFGNLYFAEQSEHTWSYWQLFVQCRCICRSLLCYISYSSSFVGFNCPQKIQQTYVNLGTFSEDKFISQYIAGISILSIVTFCGGISLLVFPAPVSN